MKTVKFLEPWAESLNTEAALSENNESIRKIIGWYYHKSLGFWVVHFGSNKYGEIRFIGTYLTKEEAKKAFARAKRMYGHIIGRCAIHDER